MVDFSDRVVADQQDFEAWKAAREGKIGASDAARFAKKESFMKYAVAKIAPMFDGNSMYTRWGHEREPVILADHGYTQNTLCYRHELEPLFLATPDGIDFDRMRLAQVKTTNKDFISKRTGEVLVPANYRRQVWWEQFVMGPEFKQTDFIYEKNKIVDGKIVPEFESKVVLIDRDEVEIAKMGDIAYAVVRSLANSKF